MDFLILYEHKNREIENCCLLAAELERRGYSTKIVNIYSGNKFWLNPKVVVVPHLYDESQLLSFCDNYKHNNFKIVSLQYEQVLRDNQHDGLHNPKGEASYAQHLAWGEAQKDRYLEHGIRLDNIHLSGHIGMDLNRREFDSYFLTKEQVALATGLDINKKWILFISTFGYRLRAQEEIDEFQKIDPTTYQSAELSIKAQNAIEKWLIRAAKENPDAIIIYRRHPSEREDPQLVKLEKELLNFRCIDAFTMRQWVRCADQMYTWYSSSIADAYYANRMCYILRPYLVPEEYELDIMHGADYIGNDEEFQWSVKHPTKNAFPIKDKVMEYYYGYNRNHPRWAYKSVADICIQVLSNDRMKYTYDYRRICQDYKVSLPIKLKKLIYHRLFDLCTIINFNFKLDNSSSKLLHNMNIYSKECYGVKRYVKITKKMFSSIIEDLSNNEI